MLKLLKSLFGNATDFKALRENGAMILDVRTPAEYQSGHINGSINVPLDMINNQIASLLKEKRTVIAVCRSGKRSVLAVEQLKNAGIEAYNGGGWNNLRKKL